MSSFKSKSPAVAIKVQHADASRSVPSARPQPAASAAVPAQLSLARSSRSADSDTPRLRATPAQFCKMPRSARRLAPAYPIPFCLLWIELQARGPSLISRLPKEVESHQSHTKANKKRTQPRPKAAKAKKPKNTKKLPKLKGADPWNHGDQGHTHSSFTGLPFLGPYCFVAQQTIPVVRRRRVPVAPNGR